MRHRSCRDDHRLAYILGEILELPGEEVASILEVPPTTVRKRLSRARERVREALESTCGIVNSEAACLCHRRLSRARQLGRVGSTGGNARLHLPQLRAYVSQIDKLERAVAFFRADHVLTPPLLRERVLTALRAVELS